MVVVQATDDEVDRLFHALADATRRDILTRALQEDLSVSGLARRYAMSLTAVQKHVTVLEAAALVTKETRGRERVVHVQPEAIRRAARLLDRYEELWRHRVRAIEHILAEDVAAERNDG
jgi:DNA-binding transcriptional ArsR family regulator